MTQSNKIKIDTKTFITLTSSSVGYVNHYLNKIKIKENNIAKL